MIDKHFSQVVEGIELADRDDLEVAVNILHQAKTKLAQVWICGNGGSAATSAHFANDLLKMCGVQALDVSGMTPATLAYGNDHGWERMFANPVLQLAQPEDVVIVFSCSGNSCNVVELVTEIYLRCVVIAFTGPDDSELSRLFDAGKVHCLVRAVAEDIKVQEDLHLIFCHAIAGELCEV